MSYVTLDDNMMFPAKEIRCMSCNKQIIAERDVRVLHGKQYFYLRQKSNLRRKRIEFLNNGKLTYIDAMVCIDCSNMTVNENEIINQIRDTQTELMKRENRTKTEIDIAVNGMYDLKPIPLKNKEKGGI